MYQTNYLNPEADDTVLVETVEVRIPEAALMPLITALASAAIHTHGDDRTRLGLLSSEIESCYRKAKLAAAQASADSVNVPEGEERASFVRGYLMAKGL